MAWASTQRTARRRKSASEQRTHGTVVSGPRDYTVGGYRARADGPVAALIGDPHLLIRHKVVLSS